MLRALRSRRVIDAVDAAYTPRGDEAEWTEHVLAALRAAFEVDGPAVGVRFELDDRSATLAEPVVVGSSAATSRAVGEMLAQTSIRHAAILRSVLLAPRRPIRSTSEVVGAEFDLATGTGAPSEVRRLARDFIGGVVQVTASRGLILGVFQPRRVALDAATRTDVTCLFAHLEAAATLRHRGPPRALATLERGAARDVTSEEVERALPRLTRAGAVMRDARAGRAPLASWTTRVDGRYSVVRGDAGATNVVENGVDDATLGAVSDRLRGVAKLLADGHPQKLVAYELGIPEGSVYRHVAALKRELGVASTVELVASLRALREGGATVVPARSREELGVLTVGERLVVEGALAGLSAKEIAAVRAGSVRTAENLLAAAYKKLGVSSRKELAARFGRT